MSDNFTIKTRLSVRKTNSTHLPEVIVKGHLPLVVVTFPNLKDGNPDEMIVDVDATGFEVEQLSAMFHALSHSLDEGKKIAEATGTIGDTVDWDDLERSAENK